MAIAGEEWREQVRRLDVLVIEGKTGDAFGVAFEVDVDFALLDIPNLPDSISGN